MPKITMSSNAVKEWCSIIICLAFLWSGCMQAAPKRRQAPKTHQAKKNVAVFKVAGLDGNASKKITVKMKQLDAVQSVKVDVEKGVVTVTLKKNKTVSANRLKQSIKQAGYRIKQTLQNPLELGQVEKRM